MHPQQSEPVRDDADLDSYSDIFASALQASRESAEAAKLQLKVVWLSFDLHAQLKSMP